MAAKSPVFPIPEPHHFSDYGFDPQFDYFQVLEEAKTSRQHHHHKRSVDAHCCLRSVDSLHFKLQKPISKDLLFSKTKNKKRRWWKNALLFFKPRRSPKPSFGPSSISCPIYITDTLTTTTSRRPSSGPLSIPYVNLRELNIDQYPPHSPMPIYLVT